MASKNTRPKATAAQSELRTEQILNMLIEEKSKAEIIQYAAENWHIATRQTETYLSRANEMLSELKIAKAAGALASHLARRRQLRFKARDKDDLRLELDVLKDEAKLLGIYAPEQLIIQEKLNEELDRALDKLEAGLEPEIYERVLKLLIGATSSAEIERAQEERPLN